MTAAAVVTPWKPSGANGVKLCVCRLNSATMMKKVGTTSLTPTIARFARALFAPPTRAGR